MFIQAGMDLYSGTAGTFFRYGSDMQRHVLDSSRTYIRHLSDMAQTSQILQVGSWGHLSDTSQTPLRHCSDTDRTWLRLRRFSDSDNSRTWLRHLSDTSQTPLRHIMIVWRASHQGCVVCYITHLFTLRRSWSTCASSRAYHCGPRLERVKHVRTRSAMIGHATGHADAARTCAGHFTDRS